MKKTLTALLLLGACLTFLHAADTPALKYDPAAPVNGGKDITLEFWTWGTLDLFKSLGEAYTKIHPNVKFNFTESAWDDYWTKLPLAIQNHKGPDLFNFHNSKEDLVLQFMAPYSFDTKALAKDYLGVASHLKDG